MQFVSNGSVKACLWVAMSEWVSADVQIVFKITETGFLLGIRRDRRGWPRTRCGFPNTQCTRHVRRYFKPATTRGISIVVRANVNFAGMVLNRAKTYRWACECPMLAQRRRALICTRLLLISQRCVQSILSIVGLAPACCIICSVHRYEVGQHVISEGQSTRRCPRCRPQLQPANSSNV